MKAFQKMSKKRITVDSKNNERIDSDINKPLQLFPIRIIPVDIGYKIDGKKEALICEAMTTKGFKVKRVVRLFGEDAILSIECSERLYFHIFADDVGVFSYQDICVEYSNISQLDAESVLSERRNAHKEILSHTHRISQLMDDIIGSMRSLVKLKEEKKNLVWRLGKQWFILCYEFLSFECRTKYN